MLAILYIKQGVGRDSNPTRLNETWFSRPVAAHRSSLILQYFEVPVGFEPSGRGFTDLTIP